MSKSGKSTIAVESKEIDVLNSIRELAPQFGIHAKLAETYGIWTLCYRRYCKAEGIPWLWMSSVSEFMDFLDARPEVSPSERNRALDGIMYYLTDVRRVEDEKDAKEAEKTRRPRSTQSLFAQLLLRCDVKMTEVLHLRAQDIRLGDSALTLKDHDGRPRTIEVPHSIRKGLKSHLQRLQDRTDATNPKLFGHRGIRPDADAPDADAPDADPPEASTEDDASRASETLWPDRADESLDRSTKLATRVMQTFDDAGEDDASDENEPRSGS